MQSMDNIWLFVFVFESRWCHLIVWFVGKIEFFFLLNENTSHQSYLQNLFWSVSFRLIMGKSPIDFAHKHTETERQNEQYPQTFAKWFELQSGGTLLE